MQEARTAPAGALAGDCVPQWDTSIGNPGMNDSVYALAVLPDGHLVAAGNFTMAGGNPANRIARWDGTDWHPLGDGLEGDGVLVLRTLANGDLIAGGNFTSAGGAPASRVARWDGTDWHPLGFGINDGAVFDLVVLPEGDVIAGGTFTMAEGRQVNHVARWDGSTWHALGDGTPHMVLALAYFDDGDGPKLYAGGGAAYPERHLSQWDGNAWSPMAGGLIGESVVAMNVADDGSGPALFVAADFRVGPTDQYWLSRSAKWVNGGWEPLDMQAVRRGRATFDDGSGPALYAGRTSPNGIVKWDGNWWMPIADGLDGSVFALAVSDDGTGPALFAAGSFDSADGESAHGIVRWQHCPPAPPVTHHVPGDFPTIQGAIDAASDGEIIRVAPGTYNEAIDFLGKTIIVESEGGPEVTIIDATGLEGPAVTVEMGSGLGTTLQGFTVTGSTLRGVDAKQVVLKIDDCIIEGNGIGEDGAAGIYAFKCDMLVRNSSILNNYASLGGAAYIGEWSPTNRVVRFRDSSIKHNTAVQGGGVTFYGARGSLVRTTIEANSTRPGPYDHLAGGTLVFGASDSRAAVHYFDCDFIGNSARAGGGFFQGQHSSLVIHKCRIHGNHSAEFGGGIYTWSSAMTTISSSVVSGNAAQLGGGIHATHSEPMIGRTFFCDNEPDHIYGDYTDLGGNVFFNVCDPVPGDLNGDGVVNVSDLLILLAAWGECDDPSNCPADLNNDGVVDVSDMLVLLANWG